MKNHFPKYHYVIYLVIVFAITLVPIAVIFSCNFIIEKNRLESGNLTSAAAQWQLRTGGVVWPPQIGDNFSSFKTQVLLAKLPHINTIVLGSSTIMGLQANMFPANMPLYSYTQNSHPLDASIAKANYFKNIHGIKWIVIDLDWYLGYLFHENSISSFDLFNIPKVISKPSMNKRLQDALSLPRIKEFWRILYYSMQSKNKLATFSSFLTAHFSSDDYHCEDGSLAKDFDVTYANTCAGFLADGSAPFRNLRRLTGVSEQKLILGMLGAESTFSKRYYPSLREQHGIPNAIFLKQLAAISTELKAKGGGLILVAPPLPPGLEKLLLNKVSYIAEMKSALAEWAKTEKIIIVDAGQSENFACSAEEFVDDHHAVSSCYRKVFRQFWNDYAHQKVTYGLYQGANQHTH